MPPLSNHAITVFELPALLDEVVLEFHRDALRRGRERYRELKLSLPAGLPARVIGEPKTLLQRLIHLTRDATRGLDIAAQARGASENDGDALDPILHLTVDILDRDDMSTRLAFTVPNGVSSELLDWTLATPAPDDALWINGSRRLEGLRTLIVQHDLRSRRVLRDSCIVAGMTPVLARDTLSAKTAVTLSDQTHRAFELVVIVSPLPHGDAVDLLVRFAQRVHRTTPAVLLAPEAEQAALSARVLRASSDAARPLALVLDGPLTPAKLLAICERAVDRSATLDDSNGALPRIDRFEPTSLDLCARAGVDIVAGLASADGNDALYRRLLRMFRDGQRTLRDVFTAAVEKNDATSVKRLAHTLRGGSVSLGMTSLSASALQLERQLKAGTPLGELTTHIEIVLLEAELIVSALEHLGPNEPMPRRPLR